MSTVAKNIMAKKLFTIRNVENLLAARTVMNQRRVRHLPVLDESDHIVGILSSKDLAIAKEFPHLRVEHVMSSPIEFVRAETTLKEAVYIMLSKKISSLVVVDENHEAEGIFTSDDLLRYLAQILEQEERQTLPWFDVFKKNTVGAVMTQLSSMGI